MVRFQPIGPSPVCYLSTGLIADGSSPRFGSPTNNEHAVTGPAPAGCCHFVGDSAVVHRGGREQELTDAHVISLTEYSTCK